MKIVQGMVASLRNLVISLFRLLGLPNIAKALRYCSWNPSIAMKMIGL